jgi:transmembrane sensor
MNKPFYDNELPWPLIEAALQGELTSEEKLQFESWLIQTPGNRELFERLELVWKEGVADYPSYLAADETRAWSEMQARLDLGAAPRTLAKGRRGTDSRISADGQAGKVRGIGFWNWAAAAAAILLMLGGAELWLYSQKSGQVRYATDDRQGVVRLADSTLVLMAPHTKIQVEEGYNTTARKLVLLDGRAKFVVTHHADRPFEVVMNGARVKDIGTIFIAFETADSIGVQVEEGEVEYTSSVTGVSRELSAGDAIVQTMTPGHRGEIKTNELRFDNAKLSDVIAALQERFGRKIGLADSALGKKRLTVHLKDESFDDAVKVICGTLNLESQPDTNGYILKNRTTR